MDSSKKKSIVLQIAAAISLVIIALSLSFVVSGLGFFLDDSAQDDQSGKELIDIERYNEVIDNIESSRSGGKFNLMLNFK
jgi:hypothetical protein